MYHAIETCCSYPSKYGKSRNSSVILDLSAYQVLFHVNFSIFWRKANSINILGFTWKKKITTRVGFSSGSQSLLVLPSSPLPSIKSSSLLKRCLHGKGKEDTDCVMDCRCNQIRCAWKAFPFGVEPCHL